MAMLTRTVASGFLVAIALLCAGTAPAAQCWVPSDDYPSIQSAVDDVTCTEIILAVGFHVGDVVIGRSLTLTGDSQDTTAVIGTVTVEGESTEATLNDFHIKALEQELPLTGLVVVGDAKVLTSGGTIFVTATDSLPCSSYAIDPTSATYGSAGGAGSVSVTTQDGCIWIAVSNVGWATITSGSPGMGSGTVTYDVSANSSPDPRTGTLTIAGQTFTIDQHGSGPDIFADGFESGDTSRWSATVP